MVGKMLARSPQGEKNNISSRECYHDLCKITKNSEQQLMHSIFNILMQGLFEYDLRKIATKRTAPGSLQFLGCNSCLSEIEIVALVVVVHIRRFV